MFLFIIEAPVSHRYVQGLVDRFGRFFVESVSNASLGTECARQHGLSDADHLRLIRLGWSPPDQSSPNWYRRVNMRQISPSPLVAEVLIRTLIEVHRADPSVLTVSVGHATPCPSPTGPRLRATTHQQVALSPLNRQHKAADTDPSDCDRSDRRPCCCCCLEPSRAMSASYIERAAVAAASKEPRNALVQN